MEPKLQKRVQRYGWDRAALEYELLWQAQLASARSQLVASASLAPGSSVLDVACGTGLVTFCAAQAVGATGQVLGIDLSGDMVEAARRRAEERRVLNVRFARMDAESLELPDASFDVALCCLGLMYMPDPQKAVLEMLRILRPGGRLVLTVWGKRSACGWATLLPIIDDEVSSEVCPLFFQLGQEEALGRLCSEAGLENLEEQRLATMLSYMDAEEACAAAFCGGPVALAWSRFDGEARARACKRYIESIAAWRHGDGYRIPGEFVVLAGLTQQGKAGRS